MFVKPYRVIRADLSDIRAVVLAQRTTWLEEPARHAALLQRGLLAEAGLPDDDHLGFRSFRPGPPHLTGTLISVPVFVGGAGPTTPGAAPDCTLDAARLAPDSTHLALAAAYRHALVDPADRALLHRVLEAAALDFLDLVADRLLELTSS